MSRLIPIVLLIIKITYSQVNVNIIGNNIPYDIGSTIFALDVNDDGT